MSGEIGNDWGDDRDAFTFTVAAAETVRIRTAGGLAVRGGLYDRDGQALAVAEGPDLRLVRTLPPGLYFVRLEGSYGAEGDYALTVDALERPW